MPDLAALPDLSAGLSRNRALALAHALLYAAGMKKRWMIVGLFAAACGGKKDDSATGSAKATEGGGGADASGMPAEVSAWMPKDAAAAWQGTWSSRLTLRTSGTMSMAGDPVALEIAGAKVKAFDGKQEHALGFELESPCSVDFTREEGGMKQSFGKHFLVKDGALRVGEGAVGYRKGKTALACTVSEGVVVVGEAGCKGYKKLGDTWRDKPLECAWSSDGGKELLTIGKGDWATKLRADGDFLVTDQFEEETKFTTKAASFDEAKAAVTAKVKANDPGEQAKAAGGKVGDTSTVTGLQATFAADQAATKGKAVEVTGLYFSSGSMTANGKTTHTLSVIDSKDSSKITLTCTLEGEAPDLRQYDKVTVKGTVGESFGKASLEACTVAKAN